MFVRRAGADDVAALAAMMVEFYAEAEFTLDPRAAERPFRALLASPELGDVWLMEADSVPAGFVVLTVAFSMAYGGLSGFVDDFFAPAPFRLVGLVGAALDAVRVSLDTRV